MLSVGIDGAAADGHRTLRVDGVIVGIGGHLAACDAEFLLRLDTLTVVSVSAHPYTAAADGDVAVGLDALGRRGVVPTPKLSTRGDHIDAATVETGLTVDIDTLAA